MKQHLLHTKHNRRVPLYGLRPLLFCLMALLLPLAVWGETTYDISTGSLTINSEDGDYIITGTTTSNPITVNGGTHTITLAGVNIDVNSVNNVAFNLLYNANVTLILAEGTTNTLKSSPWAAGLNVPEGTTLTIQGEGSLEAEGGRMAAGIGGGIAADCGTLIITSGMVTATGGLFAAGIGGGTGGNGGTIIITGGTVTATGGEDAVGIGGGMNSTSTQTLIIGPEATLGGSTEPTTNYTNGFVFNNSNEAEVRGETTLTADMTIPEGKTLTIPEGSTLTIAEDVTLTNNGTILCKGTLTNNGTIDGDGVVEYDITSEPVTIDKDGSYTISGNNQQTSNTITVKEGVTATITLNGVNISSDNDCAFKLESGADVTLILEDENTLKSGEKYAGLNVPEGTTLTIQGEGSLYAEGSNAAGIGGNDQQTCGTIIINSGTVTATGTLGAGIGGGRFREQSDRSGGEIIITGGTVIATGRGTSDSGGAGIGGGMNNTVSTIIITGGTVTATGGGGAPGIGGGTNSGFTPSLIIGPDVTLMEGTEPTTDYTNGFVFDNSDEVTVKGSPTLTADMTIPEGKTLTILNGSTLTIDKDVTLTNNGKIRIAQGGKLTPIDGITGIQYELAADMVSLPTEDHTYTGQAIEPEVTISGGSYVKGSDYTVAYSNNINVGTATVTVTPAEDGALYGDPVTKEFIISPKQLTIEWNVEESYEEGTTVPSATLSGWQETDAVAPVISYTDVEGIPVDLSHLPVGTHTITASTTVDNANYIAPESVVKTIVITAKPVDPDPDPTPPVDPDPVDPDPIDPDEPEEPPYEPSYYTVKIPESLTGAIIHGGGEHTVREYSYVDFTIEIDPNGTGQYPTVTLGNSWWNTISPDANGRYRIYIYNDVEIHIGEVPGYTDYRLVLPQDSLFESGSSYWSGAGIRLEGMTDLGNGVYEAPFGTTVTLTTEADDHRSFVEWEDGTRKQPRTLVLRDDLEVKALYRQVSPVGNEQIDGIRVYASGYTLYICTPQPTSVMLCTVSGQVIFSGSVEGEKRILGLQPGIYLVKAGNRSWKVMVGR